MRNLQDSIGSSGSNQVFILQSADLVQRQGICGNLVCEAGERPVTANGATTGNSPDNEYLPVTRYQLQVLLLGATCVPRAKP